MLTATITIQGDSFDELVLSAEEIAMHLEDESRFEKYQDKKGSYVLNVTGEEAKDEEDEEAKDEEND
jgi:hypothetical protein